MPQQVIQRDIGYLESAKIASAFTSVTAAGAGDNTQVTGTAIDRTATGSVALNALLLLAYTATLAATKTLLFKTVFCEDSDDGATGWASYQTVTDPGIVASATGANTGCLKIGFNLGGAKRFVRFNWTPDLSNTATDVATVVGVVDLAGFDRLPAA